MLHEALVLLFRDRPSLAPELIRNALNSPLPDFDEAKLSDANLSQIVPTELRADLVVLLHAGRPVLGIVVEVQLRSDYDKRFVWPLYLAALRAEHRCPCCLLVVTPSQSVARWAARPIGLGPAGDVIHPLVLGPDTIPVVTDVAQARRAPELALLSVQAHGKTHDGFDVALAAIAAATHLDDDHAMLYYDLIQRAVGESIRQKLEEAMRIQDYEFQSEFAKKYLSLGRTEGRTEGQAEGRTEGRAEGRVQAKAESVLRLLQVRGIEVAEEQRHQILKCTDFELLERWFDLAVTIAHADELFD
jgi:hypothetical protein